MSATKHGLVVGVTGPQENTAALRWAADEAERRGTVVTLVHVVNPVLPPPPPSVMLAPEPVHDLGRRALSQVSHEFADLCDGRVPHTTLLEHGHAAGKLVDLSEDADLVVVAHRTRTSRRIHTFSTAISVAAHAHCPVVAVPEGWEPAPGGEPGWVTVGVHEHGTPDAVLELAFDEARRVGAPLRLVHGWRMDTAYDDIINRRVDPHWADRVEAQMRHAVEPVAAQYPEVKVEVTVLHQWPADAVAELAPGSRLVVVGRHGRQRLLPNRIGSVARTVMATAACPVVVVPV